MCSAPDAREGSVRAFKCAHPRRYDGDVRRLSQTPQQEKPLLPPGRHESVSPARQRRQFRSSCGTTGRRPQLTIASTGASHWQSSPARARSRRLGAIRRTRRQSSRSGPRVSRPRAVAPLVLSHGVPSDVQCASEGALADPKGRVPSPGRLVGTSAKLPGTFALGRTVNTWAQPSAESRRPASPSSSRTRADLGRASLLPHSEPSGSDTSPASGRLGATMATVRPRIRQQAINHRPSPFCNACLDDRDMWHEDCLGLRGHGKQVG
jgi:hypothetical protein